MISDDTDYIRDLLAEQVRATVGTDRCTAAMGANRPSYVPAERSWSEPVLPATVTINAEDIAFFPLAVPVRTSVGDSGIGVMCVLLRTTAKTATYRVEGN